MRQDGRGKSRKTDGILCTAFSLSVESRAYNRSVRTLKEHHANEVLRIIPP